MSLKFPLGDHLTLLNVYHAYKGSKCCESAYRIHLIRLLDPDTNWCWQNYLSHRALLQADNVRNQLKRTMEKHDLELVSTAFEDKNYL